MEAWQRVKLSLTNRSIGLISAVAERQIDPNSSSNAIRSGKTAQQAITRETNASRSVQGHLNLSSTVASVLSAAGRPGGHSEGPAPDPIPNSAVKTLRANGTASQDVGE